MGRSVRERSGKDLNEWSEWGASLDQQAAAAATDAAAGFPGVASLPEVT